MNIIKSVIERIEDYRKTNAKPCKSYATEEGAERALADVSRQAGVRYDHNQVPARYVVFYVPAWGRWTGALDYTELFSRKTNIGCYIGWSGGFFTY